MRIFPSAGKICKKLFKFLRKSPELPEGHYELRGHMREGERLTFRIEPPIKEQDYICSNYNQGNPYVKLRDQETKQGADSKANLIAPGPASLPPPEHKGGIETSADPSL